MKRTHTVWSRRAFVVSTATLPFLGACSGTATTRQTPERLRQSAEKYLAEVEHRSSGRIGVAACNLTSGELLVHRGRERFAMCSTFKWLLAAAVLQRADNGQEDLSRELQWRKDDLVVWSPVSGPLVEQAHSGIASLSTGELCREMLRTSDNTAANLLLHTIGGPQGLTRFVRSLGDSITRLDRWEPELNENLPGDPRDTSTPEAMLGLMKELLYGPSLKADTRQTLKDWMIANETGLARLRAGLPDDWIVGDRSGTSGHNANNNLAFAEGPGSVSQQGPLLIVSFTNTPNPFAAESNERHANIARKMFDALV